MAKSTEELLQDVIDRLRDLPDKLASALGTESRSTGNSPLPPGERGGKSGPNFGNDLVGKFASLLHGMMKPVVKGPPPMPKLPVTKPVEPVKIAGPFPLPVSIVLDARKAPSPPPQVPRKTVIAPTAKQTILAPHQGAKTQLSSPRPTMLAGPNKTTLAAVQNRPTMLSKSPGLTRPTMLATVPKPSAMPSSPSGVSSGGSEEVVSLLKQMITLLTKMNEKQPSTGGSKDSGQMAAGGDTISGKGWQTIFDSSAPKDRAQGSPSINISVRKNASGIAHNSGGT